MGIRAPWGMGGRGMLTVTEIRSKHPGECARCKGEAKWKVADEGKRPRRLCVWCVRPYREKAA